MHVTDVSLLKRDAPLVERFAEISSWLAGMGYEVRHQSGREDDGDWEVTFIRAGEHGPGATVWCYHGETRRGLALCLARNVRPWGGAGR